jgi:thymidylate synthase (FAD)
MPYEFPSGSVHLLGHMGSDLSIINAARKSYDAESTHMGAREQRLMRHLAQHEHTGPFEHAVLSFEVTCPVYVARQFMRHRTWSYSEVSRRYTSRGLDVYEPETYRAQAKHNKQSSVEGSTVAHTMPLRDALGAYAEAVDAGVCREQARGVLPMATMTTFAATANLLNVWRFWRLRQAPEAQQEIRDVANAIGDIARIMFPHAWRELTAERGPAGMVEDFNVKYGLRPTKSNRFDMLREEVSELGEAIDLGTRAEIAKEAADVIYVALGFFVDMGIPFGRVFEAVHRSNMTKDGDTVGGKLTKGPGYEPADLGWIDEG